MFCFQCQEASEGVGCKEKKGVCGKSEETAKLQDRLISKLKAIALMEEKNLLLIKTMPYS